jgi:phospholipid-binding lipoprotein MlaA
MLARGTLGGVLVAALLLATPSAVSAEPERFNRAMLRFNQWFLEHVLEPVGRGYNVVMPKWGQRRVGAFLDNLESPRQAISSLLQAKPRRAALHTGRFLINTTYGWAGTFDVAREQLGWDAAPETFGETLGVWGVPAGPYLILPILGDFCARSLAGYVVDGFMHPLTWVPAPTLSVTAPAYVFRNVNLLAEGMPSPRAAKGEWDAYRQSRFKFDPYEVGREIFFQNETDRLLD